VSLVVDREAGLGRKCGAAGWSVKGGQSNQNPNPKLKAVDWQTRVRFFSYRLQYVAVFTFTAFPLMQARHRMGFAMDLSIRGRGVG
jgi:hypothetical protein